MIGASSRRQPGAARARVDEAEKEFERISDEVIAELRDATGARLRSLGEQLDQMDRSWRADRAALDALRPPRD